MQRKILLTIFIFFIIGFFIRKSYALDADNGINFYVNSTIENMNLAGEFNFDFIGFDSDENAIENVGSQENNFIVKRARLYVIGKIDKIADFKIKAGLEIDGASILDAFTVLHLPGNVNFHIGQEKEPFSTERMRSYCKQPFMERALSHSLALRRSKGFYLSKDNIAQALLFEAGMFTGENLNKNSTDNDFEYVGRISIFFNKWIEALPGKTILRFAAARGKRTPISGTTNSFSGKTMNSLQFFSSVPVNGYRTRYEIDFEWLNHWTWWAGEYMYSEEERNDVNVQLDLDNDFFPDVTVNEKNLKPLIEEGWMTYCVFMLTGEDAKPQVNPAHKWGAIGLALRYSSISFDSQKNIFNYNNSSSYYYEVSEASAALKRKNIDEAVSDFYFGFNWYIKKNLFFQSAVVWQWFDKSSPYLNNDKSDVNYRFRIGLFF